MKKTPGPTKAEPSAQNSANSTADNIKNARLTPRQSRLLEALLAAADWIPRESVDRIAGASNGPQIVLELRRKVTGYDGIEMQKADATAPHEVLLVIDGNTGQNALTQVKAFDDALALTGLVVTKLDGTAKGGVLCAIAREKPVPVYFIGVGEKLEDLETFNAREFAQALLA